MENNIFQAAWFGSDAIKYDNTYEPGYFVEGKA